MELSLIDSRLLQILVAANQKEYNTIDDFAELLGVSTRTVRNYISQLNDLLTPKVCQLENIRGYGYKLEIYDNKSFEENILPLLLKKNERQLLNTPEERIKYIIKRLVNSIDAITIDELAEEINVGRTTIINDLKKLTNVLNIYGVEVKGKQNGGIAIKGNELCLRLFILHWACKGLNNVGAAEYYFGNIDSRLYKNIESYIRELFEHSNVNLTDETLRGIMTYVTVMIIRNNANKCIEKIENKYEKISLTEEYILAQKIKEKIEKEFKIKINHNEIIFLTLPILARKAPIEHDKMEDIRVNPYVKHLVDKILEEVSSVTGIQIKYDRELILSLEYHLNFTLNRLTFNISTNNPLLKEIKSCYPLPYEMAKIAAKTIERECNVKVSEDEIGYIALHFGSYIERSNQKFSNIEKVALVCGTGLGTARLLYIKLRKLLGEGKIINTFSDINLTKELLDSYDVIFTTVNIGIDTEAPIIKVSALFNENELIKEIEKKYYNKKYNSEITEPGLSLMQMTIKENMFFLLNKTTFIDNLSDMLDKIINLGNIDKNFKERVIERELKSPTAFGNYVAIPHAVSEQSDKITLSMGILDKPVNWGGNEVKIIILMIIPKDNIDHDLLIKTYEELLKLCQNKKLIESISKARTYIEYKTILQKEIIS
ncbi:BglG family transcription antiterminator [Clostridium sp. SYSU_GA19001]|uniref:BglG family transcription antiterminator n=1 Tax=Clostridium caldaquaticum TaxID=2940653 RepID=UPI002076D695|nr:BglG family transcription antiterminator [Clostridium caldaquaticum]MCM8710296.1 BglG family transcription antiterminator [Clostridium caldaquaticum]